MGIFDYVDLAISTLKIKTQLQNLQNHIHTTDHAFKNWALVFFLILEGAIEGLAIIFLAFPSF